MRCETFAVRSGYDGKALVMATEWMRPLGCEKYGSDNTIWISFIEE